ncbi:ankyrin repeat domain-containing protein [Pseudomonas sp. GCM10022188]|uniref:ankyrin repeat domain-containing protein n=1 Tax=Pseudomonas TaxID=286 RepID=UPI001E4B5041|nr:ankyrin repeat domain-containing protein [Pseudomonas oryzagri]MCC6074379.1 ankyrin repeat domain-containing protein [Pseudomonas oryzagri]
MSQITEMAFHGEWKALLEVLRQSPERVNEASEGKGYAPLHQAAWHGASLPVVGELLALGADPRRVTAKQQTAQHIAIEKHPERVDLAYILAPRRLTLSQLIRKLVAEQPSLFGVYDGNQIVCDRLIEMFSLDIAELSAAELPHRVAAGVQALTGLVLDARQRLGFQVGESFDFTTDAHFWQERFIPALQLTLQRSGVFFGESWAVVADLFDPAPSHWGLRGDLFLWLEMRHALSHTALPATADALAGIVQGAFAAITGAQLVVEQDVRVPHLARGGMSSGMVSGEFWCRQGIPILQQRLEWLRESWRFPAHG